MSGPPGPGPRGGVGVVTDSVACVPAELKQTLPMEVVPVWIHLGGQSFRDGVDIEAQEVYRRLRAGEVATTSAPPPADFLAAFRRLSRRGMRQAVVITLPPEMTAIYQNARIAARQSDLSVEVLDCRTAAAAQGWVAIEAARAAARGGGLAEVVARAREVAARARLFAMVPELRYLRRGGRLVQGLARVGAALGVVPILSLGASGKIEPVALTRSPEAGEERIVREMRADAGRGRLHVTVMEADAKEQAMSLAERIRAELGPAECFMVPFTPAMGVHAGPGIVGVGYWVE